MPSKFCPVCGRITSATFIPNFCAWGCGSLGNIPILPDYNKQNERAKMIEDLKQKRIPEIKETTAIQIKLF